MAVSWLLFAEAHDTLAGTLRFWLRVPGELLLHLIPATAAGVAFAACLRRRPAAAGPNAPPTA